MRNVIIAGLTASGKTTQSVSIAQHLGLQYVSGSAIRSRLLGVPEDLAEDSHFWRNSASGESYDHARLSRIDPRDKAVDDELIALAKSSDGCVFDAWVMPWLFQEESLCVYLRSTLHTRAMRLFRCSPLASFDEVLRRVDQKDSLAHKFFLDAYGVDVFSDMSPFDVIVDCDEQDDEATHCISVISQQLSSVVRLVRSGEGGELQRFLLSVNGEIGSVKTWVRPTLIDRLTSVAA